MLTVVGGVVSGRWGGEECGQGVSGHQTSLQTNSSCKTQKLFTGGT